jgi:hypothetical protein
MSGPEVSIQLGSDGWELPTERSRNLLLTCDRRNLVSSLKYRASKELGG